MVKVQELDVSKKTHRKKLFFEKVNLQVFEETAPVETLCVSRVPMHRFVQDSARVSEKLRCRHH